MSLCKDCRPRKAASKGPAKRGKPKPVRSRRVVANRECAKCRKHYDGWTLVEI